MSFKLFFRYLFFLFAGLSFLTLFWSLAQRSQKEFCGGIANLHCQRAFTVCEIEERFSDAGGLCVFVLDPFYHWQNFKTKIETNL